MSRVQELKFCGQRPDRSRLQKEDQKCLLRLNYRDRYKHGHRQQQRNWMKRRGKHGLRRAARKTAEVAPRDLKP
jgi:hypothetical protein